MLLYDAHNHLADERLRPFRVPIMERLKGLDWGGCVVNGTSPADWEAVLALAESDARLIPAVGLHPWKVAEAPEDWRERLQNAIARGARAVGEIGLDRWIQAQDLKAQKDAFRFQFALAARQNLPVTIHCLKAEGLLLQLLSKMERPARGIHLHAFNGSVESAKQLLAHGAYFSFNGGQLKPNAKNVRRLISVIPLDQLLVETDAPDFLPPAPLREEVLPEPPSGTAPSHPANLRKAYEAVAAVRNIPTDTLIDRVEANYRSYFDG